MRLLLTTLVVLATGTLGLSTLVVREKQTTINGRPCQCVPHYECEGNTMIATHKRNSTNNGYEILDIRNNMGQGQSNSEGCLDPNERCCFDPMEGVETAGCTEDCGRSNPQGVDASLPEYTDQEAKFGEFPWVVALYDSKGTSYGAGALIHPQMVITIAHRFRNLTQDYIVRAGEWDTESTQERLPHQDREVQEVILHQDYATKTGPVNDVALLLLKTPFQLDSHVGVICLPSQGEDFDTAKDCVVSGWGRKPGSTGLYSTVLKKIALDMVPRHTCSSLIKRRLRRLDYILHESHVCAGGKEGADACTGDGGAPLACPFAPNRYKLVGLVSWGIGCGRVNVPGGYTNVAYFRSWVDEKAAGWGLGTKGCTV